MQVTVGKYQFPALTRYSFGLIVCYLHGLGQMGIVWRERLRGDRSV
jgi:hypothetical protein